MGSDNLQLIHPQDAVVLSETAMQLHQRKETETQGGILWEEVQYFECKMI